MDVRSLPRGPCDQRGGRSDGGDAGAGLGTATRDQGRLVPVRRQLLRAGTGLIAAGSGGRSADRTYRLSYGQRRFVVGLKPATTPGYADQQIGRASCRERVCQYV